MGTEGEIMTYPDTLSVTVGVEDVKAGKASSGRECPVARATNRALGLSEEKGQFVRVSTDLVYVYGNAGPIALAEYRLPEAGKVWIRGLDTPSTHEEIARRITGVNGEPLELRLEKRWG